MCCKKPNLIMIPLLKIIISDIRIHWIFVTFPMCLFQSFPATAIMMGNPRVGFPDVSHLTLLNPTTWKIPLFSIKGKGKLFIISHYNSNSKKTRRELYRVKYTPPVRSIPKLPAFIKSFSKTKLKFPWAWLKSVEGNYRSTVNTPQIKSIFV